MNIFVELATIATLAVALKAMQSQKQTETSAVRVRVNHRDL